ncbi:MAG: low specificity L-threonine aldolase [Rhodospirillaceae bacterium]
MNFASDNTAGCHPKIIQALADANDGRRMPYGRDDETNRVRTIVSDTFDTDCDVFLVATGTAANGLALSACVPGHGAVVCHETSHINEHEGTGPAMFTGGAKLIGLAAGDGKIDPAEVDHGVMTGRGDEHYAQVKALSITQLTERGTAYTVDQISAIGDVCRKHGLAMHMDGARFANAMVGLNCSPADMTWKAGVDVVSFGGTKNGALALEAVVIFNKALAAEFLYKQKRAGQLLSKMRFMSVQMEAYLKDDLWLLNARHSNAMAKRLADGLGNIQDVEITQSVDGNQVFPRLPAATVERLKAAGFLFYDRGAGPDGRHLIRLVLAFNTEPADVDKFIATAGG